MKTLLLAAGLVVSGTALAQVDVQIGLPSIHFEAAPPLVEVSPGYQVVPDQEEEIFFHDGYYWVRRPHGWFRSHDYRGHWVVVEPRYVPVYLNRVPPGQYRHWHRAERDERHMMRDERHMAHDERQMMRDERHVVPARRIERDERRIEHDDRNINRDERRERHDEHGGHDHGRH